MLRFLETNKTWHLLVIAALIAAAYANSFYNSFHFDDRYAILEDIAIQNINNLSFILSDVFSRPILRATFAINYWLGGLNVFGYHVVNLLLHMAVSVQVYFLAVVLYERFFGEDDNDCIFALLSAIVFALHPLHTGSVTYIASRSAVLAALFYVSSFILFLKALAADGYKRFLLHISACAVFIFSFGVKEITVTLPVVIAVYLFVIHKGGLSAYFERYGILLCFWLLIAAGYILSRRLFLADIAPLDTRIEEGLLPPYSYFVTELNVIVFYYLKWLILPFDGPHVDPDIPAETTIFDGSTIIAAMIIAGLVAASLWRRKKWPMICFGILWYFITLMPTSSIFPIGDVAVERHVYIPAIGFSLIAGYVLGRARDVMPMKIFLPVYAALFITLAYFTIASNFIWKNELTLWEDAAKKAPNKIRVLNNRAYGYYLAGDLNKAEYYYKELLEAHPEYPFGHNNLGLIYQKKGDINAAIGEYQTAVAIRPGNQVFRMNLGSAYDAAGLFDRAAEEFKAAVKLNHMNPQALTNLASVLAKAGEFSDAIRMAKKAIEIEPENYMANYILGYSYEMSGLFKEALNAYSKALEFNPDWELPKKRISGLQGRP